MKKHNTIASTMIIALLTTFLVATPGHAKIRQNTHDENVKIVHDETNAYREKHNLTILQRDQGLDKVAQKWAEHMAEINRMYHNSKILEEVPKTFTYVGENVAWLTGYGNDSAYRVVNNWINSPSHKENMDNPQYDHLGVGYYTDDRGKTWVVQVFAKDTGGKKYTVTCEYTYTSNVKGQAVGESSYTVKTHDGNTYTSKAKAKVTIVASHTTTIVKKATSTNLEHAKQTAEKQAREEAKRQSQIKAKEKAKKLAQEKAQKKAKAKAKKAAEQKAKNNTSKTITTNSTRKGKIILNNEKPLSYSINNETNTIDEPVTPVHRYGIGTQTIIKTALYPPLSFINQ